MTAPGTGWREEYLGGSLAAENAALAAVMDHIAAIQQTVSRRQNAEIRRGFHNKGTPVRVVFETAADLPEHLRVRPFLEGLRSEGFGRFSRSQSLFQEDRAPDQRGFAFRLEDGDRRQDFLFSNTPLCFATDPVVFLNSSKMFAATPRYLIPVRLIFRYGIPRALRMLRLLLRSPESDIGFTSQTFWSRTPFAIGASAVKFVLTPTDPEIGRAPDTGDDALTDHLREELARRDRQFVLSVQHYIDDRKTPIERSDVPWTAEDSPLLEVGILTIPKQDLDPTLTERVEREEAFNPWVTEFIRPLGSLNRARREAYRRSAVQRGVEPVSLATSGSPEEATS